jgi:hypothetical protein
MTRQLRAWLCVGLHCGFTLSEHLSARLPAGTVVLTKNQLEQAQPS